MGLIIALANDGYKAAQTRYAQQKDRFKSIMEERTIKKAIEPTVYQNLTPDEKWAVDAFVALSHLNNPPSAEQVLQERHLEAFEVIRLTQAELIDKMAKLKCQLNAVNLNSEDPASNFTGNFKKSEHTR